MKSPPKISDAELRIMKILWQKHPLTTNEVVNKLAKRSSWSDQTIRTLLKRLVDKKVLRAEKDGRQFKYTPLFTRDQIVKHERRSFLDRFYDGAASRMLAAFIEDESLSDKDLKRLKALLEQCEGESRGDYSK